MCLALSFGRKEKTMRRNDREVTNREELKAILEECKVCRIAMRDEQGLYLVPLNFGYLYEEGSLRLFLHSAGNGRKVDALRSCGEVAFEMDCGHQLIESDLPCNYSYTYRSIIGTGQVRELTEDGEKAEALKRLMLHQSGKTFSFEPAMLKSVVVFEIQADTFTGKRRS